MPPLLKIRAERDQMSAIERRIADFLLENSHLLRDYSSQQVADALNISQSSVVKFSQKLGFKGYPDLKFSIGEAVARTNGSEATRTEKTTKSKRAPLTETLWSRKTQAEEETRTINSSESFEAVTEILNRTGKVVVCGLGEDGIYAAAFAVRLATLGIAASACSDVHLLAAQLGTLESGDTLCVIAEHGKMPALARLCKIFHDQRGKIITLTRNTANAVRLHADVSLLISAHDERAEVEQLLYQSMLQQLLDLVFLLLCEDSDARLKQWHTGQQRAKQLGES